MTDREPTGGWTVNTLLALMDERDRRYAEGKAASDHALQIALDGAEKWRANANEWRAAMADREAKFVQSNEFKAEKENVARELAALREFRAALEGKATQGQMILAIAISVLSLAATVVGMVLKR